MIFSLKPQQLCITKAVPKASGSLEMGRFQCIRHLFIETANAIIRNYPFSKMISIEFGRSHTEQSPLSV